MTATRFPRLAVLCLSSFASGCTTLRVLPRHEYAVRPERKHIVVETRAGLHYEFESVRFDADSLVGTRRKDVEGTFDEYDSMSVPLEDVAKLSTRQVDWYRTGLIGGTVLAAVLAGAISRAKSGNGGTPTGPCGIRPCPE
jgi:hypothetical protein